MSAGAGFLRGVSSGWFALLIAVGTQLIQVRWARDRLSADEFALLNIISNLVTAFLIAEIGVRAAFSRLLLDAMASGEEHCRRLWANTHCLLAAQSGFMMLLGFTLAPFVPGWFHAPSSVAGTVQSVFVSLCAITSLQYGIASHQLALLATQRFVLVNAVSVAGTLVAFAVFGWGLRAGCGLWSYVWSALAALLVGGGGTVVATGWLRLSRPFHWALVSGAEMRRILGLGIDLFFVSLYSLFLSQSLLLFAGQFLSLAMIGILAINMKLVQFMVQLCQRVPGTAETILSRMVAENDLERFRRSWGLAAKASVLTCVLGGGCLYFWAPLGVSWWTSPEDRMGGAALALLVLTPVRYIVYLTFVLPAVMFKAANRLRGALLWEVAVYIGLVLSLGPRWGLVGVLAANLMSLVVGAFWPGVRLFAELSGFSVRHILGVAFQSLVVPLLIYGALVWWVPQPEALGWGGRVSFSGLFVLSVVAWTLWRGLSAGEKELISNRWAIRLPFSKT